MIPVSGVDFLDKYGVAGAHEKKARFARLRFADGEWLKVPIEEFDKLYAYQFRLRPARA